MISFREGISWCIIAPRTTQGNLLPSFPIGWVSNRLIECEKSVDFNVTFEVNIYKTHGCTIRYQLLGEHPGVLWPPKLLKEAYDQVLLYYLGLLI